MHVSVPFTIVNLAQPTTRDNQSASSFTNKDPALIPTLGSITSATVHHCPRPSWTHQPPINPQLINHFLWWSISINHRSSHHLPINSPSNIPHYLGSCGINLTIPSHPEPSTRPVSPSVPRPPLQILDLSDNCVTVAKLQLIRSEFTPIHGCCCQCCLVKKWWIVAEKWLKQTSDNRNHY